MSCVLYIRCTLWPIFMNYQRKHESVVHIHKVIHPSPLPLCTSYNPFKATCLTESTLDFPIQLALIFYIKPIDTYVHTGPHPELCFLSVSVVKHVEMNWVSRRGHSSLPSAGSIRCEKNIGRGINHLPKKRQYMESSSWQIEGETSRRSVSQHSQVAVCVSVREKESANCIRSMSPTSSSHRLVIHVHDPLNCMLHLSFISSIFCVGWFII